MSNVEIIALELYKNLNWYKKWKIRKYCESNQWDSSGYWVACLDQALVMDKIANLSKYEGVDP